MSVPAAAGKTVADNSREKKVRKMISPDKPLPIRRETIPALGVLPDSGKLGGEVR